MKTIRILVLLSLMLLAVNSFADDKITPALASSRTADQGPDAQALQRWNDLSAEQQQTLRERYRQYQALTPAQQMQLRQNLLEFKAMSPQQQQRIQERFQRWQALPLEKRQQLRQLNNDFSRLTPEEQQQLRQELELLKDLPEAERAEGTQQLRQNYMGGQHQINPGSAMPRQPMRRMGK